MPPKAKNTIETVRQFLSRRPGTSGTLDGRVLVCTHATMALVFKRLTAGGELGLLSNCLLWIDEAHHVLNAQVEDSNDIVSNALGHLVLHCFEPGYTSAWQPPRTFGATGGIYCRRRCGANSPAIESRLTAALKTASIGFEKFRLSEFAISNLLKIWFKKTGKHTCTNDQYSNSRPCVNRGMVQEKRSVERKHRSENPRNGDQQNSTQADAPCGRRHKHCSCWIQEPCG